MFLNFYALKRIKPNNYSLSIVDESKVLKLLKLCSNKATGLNDIPSRLIKDSAYNCKALVSYHKPVNNTGDHKLAIVVKTDISNYRPVSIPSVISKILERMIYDQFEEYLSKNKLLFNYQSGFRQVFHWNLSITLYSKWTKQRQDQQGRAKKAAPSTFNKRKHLNGWANTPIPQK